MKSEQTHLRWAIIGVGRAGRARARAMARDPRATIAAVHRGRYAAEVDAPHVSFEAALARADAVAICTPDALHVAQVEQALQAGLHVVVEYPLGSDRPTAERLFALADAKKRVLHVEHIEILHAPQAILRAHCRRELLQRIDVHFERGGDAEAGPEELARTNIARLHRVVDLGGPVRRIDSVEVAPGRLRGRLTLAMGIEVGFTFQSAPYYKRRTQIEVDATAAIWKLDNDALYRGGAPQTVFAPEPLFEQDHAAVTAAILDARPLYVQRSRVLHVLELCEQLGAGRTGALREASW